MKALFAKHARLPDGWARDVVIRIDADGTIDDVNGGAPCPDDAGCVELLVPGIPNIHSHAFQRALAGRLEQAGTEPDSFWTWRAGMYACVDQISAAELNAIATYVYVEMLKAGYTSVGEFHYLHNAPAGMRKADPTVNSRAIIGAAAAAGIRLTLLPVLYLHGGFGSQSATAQQQRFMITVENYLALLDTLRGEETARSRTGIAFHSLRAVSPEAIDRVLEHHYRTTPDGPVHIHAAEQQREVEDCQAWSTKRPVEWLLDLGCINRHWCIVHATHMLADEIRALAATGAVAGLCPTTEANLGDGLFPLADYLDAGGQLGIGSDSHVSVNPFEELRWLEYGQRLIRQQRNIAANTSQPHTGARLFDAVLDGGARALGQPVGRIAANCRADLLVLDHCDPLLAGCTDDELLDALVFASTSNPVTDVMVAGHWVVRERRHELEDDAARAFAATRQRLVGAIA